METDIKCGLMGAYTRGNGQIIYKMVEVDSFMLMGEYMKVNGKIVKLMELVLILMLMELNT